jgi:hypothetical protein
LVYVTWHDFRFGSSDIYFNRSVDEGLTWLSHDLRLDTGSMPGAALSFDPQIAASGSSVYVTWSDFRNGFPFPDIYFNRSVDGGLAWLAQDLRLDTGSGPGVASSYGPQIAASGSSINVTWYDHRNGLVSDIYFNRSVDGGQTWLSQDSRLDTGSGAGVASSYDPQIAASGSSVYVTWSDSRAGAYDIYFNIPFGFQSYGTGTIGSGNLIPSMSGAGLAVHGLPISLDVSDGLGGAVGILHFGLDGQASIPALGGTLLVAPPLVSAVIGLGGAAGQPGAGTVSFPLGIPNNPNLVGIRLNFQSLFLDEGAPAGVSMTNGLELWIG